MNRLIWTCALAIGLLPGVLMAQGSPGYENDGRQRQQENRQDSFARYLYPAELVMRFQADLDLSDEQRDAISAAVADLQRQAMDFQWRMAAEMEALSDLVSEPRVDEAAAVAAMDRVLATEQGVKTAHLAMLVRIKNTLTQEQQAELDRLRAGQSGSSW